MWVWCVLYLSIITYICIYARYIFRIWGKFPICPWPKRHQNSGYELAGSRVCRDVVSVMPLNLYDVRNVKPTSSVDMFSEKFHDFASSKPIFPIRIFQAFHTQHYQHLNILQLGLVQPGESISSMIGIFPFLTNRWAKWASAFGYGRYFAYVWTVVVPLGWRWVHEKSMKLPEIQEIYCRSMVYMEIWNKLK